MFRPCIDLHEGKVKQIVGGTLGAEGAGLRTNFVASQPAAWFAGIYRADGLKGGHVIMLGPGNEEEARSALSAYPGGLQVGGGINAENAVSWLDWGASHVIVTSWVFRDGRIDRQRLDELVRVVGSDRLVLDLSCRKRDGRYFVVTNRFQTFTDVMLGPGVFTELAGKCAEFLVHAVDVEGLCRGIDEELVKQLAEWSPLPITYAGGVRTMADLETVERLGRGRIDLTIGTALDIFGGTLKYREVVRFYRSHSASGAS